MSVWVVVMVCVAVSAREKGCVGDGRMICINNICANRRTSLHHLGTTEGENK